MQTGDSWNFAKPEKILAVADRTLNGLASAGSSQLFTLLDAAHGNIPGKSGMWVAVQHQVRVQRQFDNPISQRLAAAASYGKAHPPAVDEAFGHGVGLHHFHPLNRFERSEIFGGLPCIVRRKPLGDGNHSASICADSALEIGEFTLHILRRKAAEGC